VAAIIFGDLASQEVAPRASLRILFVYEDNPGVDPRGMCHRFGEVLGQLTHDNLLFEPFSRGRKDRIAYTLAEFPDHCQSAASSVELLDLTRARCIFTTGDPGIGARFDEIRNGILAHGPARDSLVTKLGERDEGGAGELLAVAMERGIRDVERAARYLQLTRLSEIPEIPGAGDAASIFQAAEAGKVIFSPVAEQLVSASRMWRSLRGIHRLVLDDDTAIEAASDTTRATLAECCDLPDFDALVASVRETAAATASGLESVFEQEN
jgi:glutamine synthetase adenylyltransferase